MLDTVQLVRTLRGGEVTVVVLDVPGLHLSEDAAWEVVVAHHEELVELGRGVLLVVEVVHHGGDLGFGVHARHGF